MKIFTIRNEELDTEKALGWLLYFEKQKTFYIELPEDADSWNLPPVLFNFAQNGQFTVDAGWSRVWVQQRIVPCDRQNLGEILRDNGLKEYDEYKLLMLDHGRCSQDGCYLEETSWDALPMGIRKRASFKVDGVFPLQGNCMLVFFRDGTTRLCDIGSQVGGNPRYQRLLSYYEEFQKVRILAGGYGIGWNSGQEIRDSLLYDSGTAMPFSLSGFRSALSGSLVNTQEACRMLGCSRQYISQLVKEEKLVPLLSSEKSTIFFRTDLMR